MAKEKQYTNYKVNEEQVIGNGHGNGKSLTDQEAKDLIAHMDDNTINNAYKTDQSFNAAKVIVTVEDEMIKNAFRFHHPSKAYSDAAVSLIFKFEEIKYQEGINFVLSLCANTASVHGNRMKEFVNAITGGERNNANDLQRKNVMEKLKNFNFGK